MTFINPDSEGALEANTIGLFKDLGWKAANCYHEICGANSTLGRETSEQVVLERRLKAALEKLNPEVPPLALDLALDELTKDRSVLSPVRANQEVYKLLKDGIIILSNGSKSRIGSITAGWEHFAEWKKINDEGEEGRVSLETMIRGVCEPARLLDIVENFTLFEAKGEIEKLVAKNHQYLGVNKAISAAQQI